MGNWLDSFKDASKEYMRRTTKKYPVDTMRKELKKNIYTLKQDELDEICEFAKTINDQARYYAATEVMAENEYWVSSR